METVSLVTKTQEQALNTNHYQTIVLHTFRDSTCRTDNRSISVAETVTHILTARETKELITRDMAVPSEILA